MPNHFGGDHEQRYYGAAPPFRKPEEVRRSRPGRFNFAAMCLSVFLPWLLFCLIYAVMSFSMHYKDKSLCFSLCVAGLVIVVAIGKSAFDSIKKQQHDANNDSSWLVFLTAACLIAWVSGLILGDLNYFYNMEPYYDVKNLNVYNNVDPSVVSGQEIMDFGRMTFKPGSRLELSKTMAFKNLDTYCVAPIVNNRTGNRSFLDFWAVGKNCCSGRLGDFTCGEYNNPFALSGLRVMRDDHREFYRLAVRQAEAAYSIKAKHPLFIYWMQDPVAEIAAYLDEGIKYYLFGVFTFFAFSFCLTIVAAVFFAIK